MMIGAIYTKSFILFDKYDIIIPKILYHQILI